MKTFKKVLAAALSAVMLVSTMAIPSFAAGSPTTKDISKATVKVEDQTYTGQEITPAVTVTLDGQTLTANKDYKVTFTPSPVKDAGSYTAKVEGIAPYAGTVTATFQVVKPADDNAAATNNKPQEVTASAKKAVTTTVKLDTSKAIQKKTVAVKKVKLSNGADKKTAKKIKVTVTGKGKNQKLKIKIPKGAKKGTYKIQVKYKVKGGKKFKTKTVTVKVKKAKKK